MGRQSKPEIIMFDLTWGQFLLNSPNPKEINTPKRKKLAKHFFLEGMKVQKQFSEK